MKERLFKFIGLLVLLSMLLTACATPAPAQPTTVPNVAVPAIKKGGTLIVARAGDAKGLDPHKQTAFTSFRVLELVYDTLLTLDKDMNIAPSLAESWKWSEDGKTLTMKIRSNVKFHNGDALSAEDVKFSYERILDEKTGAAARSSYASIASIEAPDASTVVFKLKEANVALLAAMTSTNSAILDKKALTGGMDPAKDENGTGPFKINKWEPDKTLILDANKDYWIAGQPYLDKIEMRTIPDEASILAALRAGTVDWALINDPRVAITATSGGAKLNIMRVPALAYHVLQLNPARDMFKNVKVRQALSCAIDRKQVLDTASLGEGEITPPATPLFYRANLDQLFCYKQDVEKAKSLLNEAGVKNLSFTVIAATGEPPTAVAEAQNIQAQLKNIGVEMKIETLELGVYVDRWMKGDFDAAVALNGGNPDPHNMFSRYWISTGNLQKVSNYSTPELDTLLAKGAATTDPAARKTIYDEVQKKLVEAAPWIWLYVGYEYRIMQPTVQGFVSLPSGSTVFLRETWLNK